MKANTLGIQSYRPIKPVSKRELHAVSADSAENSSAAIINIVNKSESSLEKAGPKGWVMPPIVYAYMKGKDNDPL
ncbi:MAG: hypothetical protein H7Y03_15175 [Chitinophagaceae bacterium]|nr:hypothetical protein [Chitinophagaceae bacterium]